MQDKKHKDGRKKGNNPTGKGGLKDRPNDAKKGPVACSDKAQEKRETQARLFREELQLYKDNMRSIALYGEEEATRMRATQIILKIIEDGKLESSHASTEASSTSEGVKKEATSMNLKERISNFPLQILDDPTVSAQAKLKACEMLEVRLEKNGDVTNNEKLDYVEKLYYEERKAREKLESELKAMRERLEVSV